MAAKPYNEINILVIVRQLPGCSPVVHSVRQVDARTPTYIADEIDAARAEMANKFPEFTNAEFTGSTHKLGIT
jgi:DNA-binding IscR family transcriptional regulator